MFLFSPVSMSFIWSVKLRTLFCRNKIQYIYDNQGYYNSVDYFQMFSYHLKIPMGIVYNITFSLFMSCFIEATLCGNSL